MKNALNFAGYLQGPGHLKRGPSGDYASQYPTGVISYFGILMAGAIVVQTNPLYTERELEYQMKDSGAKAIITLDILYPRVSKVMPQTEFATYHCNRYQRLPAISKKSHLSFHPEKTIWNCRKCKA